MSRSTRFWCGFVVIGLSIGALLSCDYSAPESLDAPRGARVSGPGASPKLLPSDRVAATAPRAQEERTAILESSITLIQRAAVQPGGAYFGQAIQKLNNYFEGTSPSEYHLDPTAREYLLSQLPPATVRDIENRNWTLRDARHIEDCMMYYGIAARVAGTGDELARVRRIFDWVVRQVQLVPPGSLGSGQLAQAFARPYDVLMRGMATEADGYWAERSWLFMALCRQLGIDSGLITYSKSSTLEPVIPKFALNIEQAASAMGMRRASRAPVIWICAVLIDNEAYLFDARLGLEVPGPDGTGVATLNQVLIDPAILERMNLPGLSPYGTSHASLLGSPTKIGILIDSSLGYFAPKMRMLQRELAGKNRTILYCDPAEQRDHFARVLGRWNGGAKLWGLPVTVETQLFTNAQFVESLKASLFLFQRDFPLVYARVKQLRGELDEAIPDYVKLRLTANAALVTDRRKTIPKGVQDGLDIYATYYLALAHMEQNNLRNAEDMLRMTLEMLPEYGPNQPYYNMFRWGANANLARIYEAKKDNRRAIAYYVQGDPTPQYVGNQLRARELVWRDPMADRPDPLPPAPSSKPVAPASPAPERRSGGGN